jgi:16S rRNA (guanine527-N7)-methyltransferase
VGKVPPSPVFGDRVTRLATALGRELEENTRRALTSYLSLLAEWNQRIDLTAARTDDELVDLMLADALVLAARLPSGATVVDVGSGAGAPGLPLALARPDLRITLVEPLQKRVAFLRTVLGTLLAEGGAPVVVRARGEELKAQAFDVAISRATLSPERWLALGHELAPRGDVWVFLAREAPPGHAVRQASEDFRYVWPLTHVERRAVRYAA